MAAALILCMPMVIAVLISLQQVYDMQEMSEYMVRNHKRKISVLTIVPLLYGQANNCYCYSNSSERV